MTTPAIPVSSGPRWVDKNPASSTKRVAKRSAAVGILNTYPEEGKRARPFETRPVTMLGAIKAQASPDDGRRRVVGRRLSGALPAPQEGRSGGCVAPPPRKGVT